MDNNLPIEGTKSVTDDKHPRYTCLRTLVKWFFYQIFACFIPWLLGLFFTWITDYEINAYEVTGDYLLVAFAIGINLKGYELKSRENIHPFFIDVYKFIAACITIFAGLIYISFFNVDYISNKIKICMENNHNLIVAIYCFSFVFIIIETVINIACELRININKNGVNINE